MVKNGLFGDCETTPTGINDGFLPGAKSVNEQHISFF